VLRLLEGKNAPCRLCFDIAYDSSMYISLNGINVRLYAKGLMENIVFPAVGIELDRFQMNEPVFVIVPLLVLESCWGLN
jgi:hypothetical protein